MSITRNISIARQLFRAVGSSANCGCAMIALNTAVASQLKEFRRSVDARMAAGEQKEHAIFELLREYIRESKPIRFDSNGYSDEWR